MVILGEQQQSRHSLYHRLVSRDSAPAQSTSSHEGRDGLSLPEAVGPRWSPAHPRVLCANRQLGSYQTQEPRLRGGQ